MADGMSEHPGADPIRGVSAEVCLDCCDLSVIAEFWSNLLGYRIEGEQTAAWVHLEPAHPRLPILNLQLVPEAKQGKNRLHLDIYVDDPPMWIERCETLGATRLRVNEDPRDWYFVMADPEGNEFCICLENLPAAAPD